MSRLIHTALGCITTSNMDQLQRELYQIESAYSSVDGLRRVAEHANAKLSLQNNDYAAAVRAAELHLQRIIKKHGQDQGQLMALMEQQSARDQATIEELVQTNVELQRKLEERE